MEKLDILRCQVWKSILCPIGPMSVQRFKDSVPYEDLGLGPIFAAVKRVSVSTESRSSTYTVQRNWINVHRSFLTFSEGIRLKAGPSYERLGW